MFGYDSFARLTFHWLRWALLIMCATVLLADEDARYTLTDTSGRTLDAIILECSATDVRVERYSDGRRFTIQLDTLSEADQHYLTETFFKVKAEPEADVKPLLTPGTKILLDFPELGPMADGKPAQCELSIPKNYDPANPVPLLVWFSGGKGSYRTSGANGLVDFDEFLVLALPYPDGRLPRLAVAAGEIDEFWEFQRPMLDRVMEMAPNICSKLRIAGGASSGGHLVGSALDQKWRGFCDYFTAFVLHEGGTSPNMTFSGTRSSHRILVIYGEVSTARQWQMFFINKIKEARGRMTFLEVPGAGHGLNGDGRRMIRKWIDDLGGC